MRLDHLLSKEHHQLWWPFSCPSVVGVVAHGWNIDEWALRSGSGWLVLLRDGTLVWSWVRGGGTLLGCEAARGPRFLGVCGWSSPPWLTVVLVVGVWGCFLRTA